MDDDELVVGGLLALGAFHGINPGMGWLFAVALGMQERRRAAVWRALVPLALGSRAWRSPRRSRWRLLVGAVVPLRRAPVGASAASCSGSACRGSSVTGIRAGSACASGCGS